jgi:Golgi nucleoside diphosphatase
VSGSSVKILNNTITQNKIGVKAEGAQDLSIARNSFLGNFTDIEMKESYGNVKKNYFQGSLTCLKLLESYPQVEGNYFEQAHKYVMEFNNDSDLAITENWWGRGDRKRIKDLISLEGKGKVHFDSFLKEPQQLNEVGVDLAEGL